MAFDDYKITESDYTGKDVASLPDDPVASGISIANFKAWFDKLVKLVVTPKFNAFLDRITDTLQDDATTVPTGAAVVAQLSESGLGDMLKATYDPNNDGIVAYADWATSADQADMADNSAMLDGLSHNDSATGSNSTTNNAFWSAYKILSVLAAYNIYGIRYERSAAQSIPTGASASYIDFNSQIYTFGSGAPTRSDTGVYKITTAGIYRVTAGVSFADNTAGVRRMFIGKYASDGTTSLGVLVDRREAAYASGASSILNLVTEDSFDANTTIKVGVTQTSGSALNVEAVRPTFLCITRIS